MSDATIGIKEIKGKPAQMVGIGSAHLDDASIQQFVNSKLNRPLEFGYSEFAVAELTIAG